MEHPLQTLQPTQTTSEEEPPAPTRQRTRRSSLCPASAVDVAVLSCHKQWRQSLAASPRPHTSAIVLHLLGSLGQLPLLSQQRISVSLADDSLLHHLNLTYLGRDYPTNVIAFPYTETAEDRPPTSDPDPAPAQDALLGDIAISYQRTLQESHDLGITFAEHYAALLIHGTLHLLGYDHETDADFLQMNAVEARIMQELGYNHPLTAPALQMQKTGQTGQTGYPHSSSTITTAITTSDDLSFIGQRQDRQQNIAIHQLSHDQ